MSFSKNLATVVEMSRDVYGDYGYAAGLMQSMLIGAFYQLPAHKQEEFTRLMEQQMEKLEQKEAKIPVWSL